MQFHPELESCGKARPAPHGSPKFTLHHPKAQTKLTMAFRQWRKQTCHAVPVPLRLLVQREQPQETQEGPDLCAGLCWGGHHSLPEMPSEREPAHTSQNHTKMAHPTKKPPQMAGLGCLDRRHDSLQNALEFFLCLPYPRKHFKSIKRKTKYFFDPKQLFCIKTHFTPSTPHCPVWVWGSLMVQESSLV